MGTTAQKLQKALDNKQLIIDKVNNKAGTSFDINSKLSDVANAIDNIQSGIDTSDATATTSDILKGKTAYVNDEKIEGTIETYNGENENGAILDDMLQARVDATNSCKYLFYNYTRPNVDYISGLDTSNVTDMSYMFSNCSELTTIPQLNTSKVTNMNSMFYACSKLTSIPQLNTSKVVSMKNMFGGCSALTTIPLLDTSNVTDMSYMFQECKVLGTIDITYYNISSTSNASYFAYNCTSLKILIIRSFGTSYSLNNNAFNNSGIAKGTGYIYVPRAMVDTLKSATNWSTYADQIRALEDYTIDGTTTGALDESKI